MLLASLDIRRCHCVWGFSKIYSRVETQPVKMHSAFDQEDNETDGEDPRLNKK